jgi:hypothetical protein
MISRRPLGLLPAIALMAMTAAATPRVDQVRLLAPAAGDVLEGGSKARIAWEAVRELDPHVEEWEAFLSVDGGRYYGYRITPHLDDDLHSFEWIVPDIDAADARILLRVGDEKREEAFEIPFSFSIRRGIGRTIALDLIAGSESLSERGEAARPGDEPVAEWLDGDRRGASLALRVRDDPGVWTAVSIPSDLIETNCAEPPSSRVLLSPSSTSREEEARAPWQRSPSTASPYAADILLLARRLNL